MKVFGKEGAAAREPKEGESPSDRGSEDDSRGAGRVKPGYLSIHISKICSPQS